MKALLSKILLGLTLSGAVLLAIPSAQAAEDDAIAKAIKARRGGFQLYSFYAGKLFAMAKGEMEYDAALAATMANNLNTVVNLDNGTMWLPGSSKKDRKGKTRAKPEIWKEGSKIGEKAKALSTATAEVAAVAGDGLDALRGAVSAVGKGCKGCHDSYRAKEF